MSNTAEVIAYLSATGWHDTGRTWRGGALWATDDVTVLVPADEVRDHAERLHDLLNTVAEVEERPVDAVLRGLRHPLDDELTFAPDGDLPLEAGAASLRGLRLLLVQSARSVVEGPHRRFHGPDAPPVVGLVDSVLLGSSPTVRSGFSLHVPAGQDTGLSGREVTRQVRDVVVAAARGVENEEPALLVQAALLGLSVGCCTALANLGVPGRGFGLGIRYAAGGGLESPAHVTFPPMSGVVLRAARRQLSRDGSHGEGTASGVVDGLHDEPGSRDRWRARVRGEVLPDDGSVRGRVVWVRFDSQRAYDRMVEHYNQARSVRVTGELASRDGRIELVAGENGVADMGGEGAGESE
ncbi:hypothetical protein [Actinomycetospora termitidis]|uniref:Uncharacterized protein n=1 Tax=Actinomycetospora termitidis TaxID=3053470 RepID=A0ABT7MGH5_9PSEU|nr:hypothetical protein [Actinomycetospora sp. Odt1-22]MDL5159269.1 hypothetical protein [Actinomycetospora sp. Odt1-22]